jgi:rfaE bifunctional protein kinase chain/domain
MKNNLVLVSGYFNVLHPGHLRLLRFAKELGGRLIVAVESDRLAGKSAHVLENLRLEGVQSIGWVDEAFILDDDIATIINRFQPDIVVKGKEHELRLNSELLELEKYGGKLVFSSGETQFSSFDLIRKEFKDYEFQTIKLPQEFLLRHNISLERLIDLIRNFQNIKVCVVGDLIVDEYITCQPLGMSQEDPSIVVTPVDSTLFIGGAGIVAAHAAGLGASVQFFSITGEDAARTFALEALNKVGVNTFLQIDDSRPTTLKQRYRTKGKTLLRVSHLHQGAISLSLQTKMIAAIERTLASANLIVFSDFNYGCLPQPMLDQLIQLAERFGVVMVADSQSSSQVGDISRFRGMDLITPTEREARISIRNREDGLVILAEELRQQASARNVLLKLGEEGLLIHAPNDKGDGWLTDRILALNSAPKDVAGAGDSLLIASAMALVAGGNIWEAACIGSLAAAVQVGRVGNTPLRTKELLRELA